MHTAERGVIFRTDHDRQVFLDRLATLVLLLPSAVAE